eukprot:Anaeramoba_flamelloidesa811884_69.p1 GENE.a811884_69~~a811884_69.p1  ORF type:complete len:277 (-),score=78.52 a811884_69:148-978(-)
MIPIGFYHQHVKKIKIEKILTKKKFIKDRQTKIQSLKKIRAQIMDESLDKALIEKIKEKIENLYEQIGCHKGLIFRSSSNAEDMPGFIGAGLYLSQPIPKDPADEQIEKVVKEIYSSLWGFKAFQERDLYNLNQAQVKMAVLVQPYYDKETIKANCVCLTTNPFRPNLPSYFINAQSTEGSVTDSIGVAEQLIVFTLDKKLVTRIVSKSSLKKKQEDSVLKKADVANIFDALRVLDFKIGGKYWRMGFQAIDCEILVTKDQKVIVVQARPYKTRKK